MKECIAEMPSYTYAVKSQRLLRSRGFPCEVARTERGCGYRLIISRSCSEALRVLKLYDILYRTEAEAEDHDKL